MKNGSEFKYDPLPTREKIIVQLDEWSHTCGDGCCDTYGTDIIVNGVKLEGEDGTSNQQLLRAVLEHLGYEVEIKY